MLDYLLNKLSKYLNTPNTGKEVDASEAESTEPKQIRLAKQFHGWDEIGSNKQLQALMGINPATTPWCAGFVGAIEKACGRKGTGKMLARSYMTYGTPVTQPKLGDIVVFRRGNSSWQGHVGYYAGEDRYNILSLGGNQSNKVCYSYYPKNTVLAFRRPQ